MTDDELITAYLAWLDDATRARVLKLKPEHRLARARNWRRNSVIQAVGPRPADGVTFGSGKAPK